ncbi:MAG: hypothetical protein K8T25_19465 [Planctomycetia bacterium]|nr:hypothetical protein [Planctomycetia bacterium]
MNLQKLVKKIRHEAKANPGKAGLLALVTVVALWFWAPLLSGWFSTAKPEAAAPAVPAPATGNVAAVAAPGVVAAASAAAPTYKWQDVMGKIRQDHMMKPAAPLVGTRDPFAEAMPPKPKVEAQSEAPKIVKLDAESLGLVLTSTLIGPRQNVATINGRTYALPRGGSQANSRPVQVVVDQQGQTLKLNLLLVEPTRVLLEYEGQRFSLALKEKKLNSKSTFEVSGETAN